MNCYDFVLRTNFSQLDYCFEILFLLSNSACFRRVLAGKRVAPHWVRRTIACERVEECMRECGREKRFTCEGFNYRLDPSGHGQGDCELIEIPLAQIDLYSSPNRKDSNLLRHPDYDYYERDRNAPPSCRYNMCNECPSKPPPPVHYNKPSSGWSDKPYREEQYVPSPPSGGYFGRPASSGSSSFEHYGSSGPSGPPPPPPPGSHSGSYESHARPPYSYEHQSGSYEFSSHGSGYYEHSAPGSYGSSGSGQAPIDRYDSSHRDRDRDHYRPAAYPSRWETIPSSSGYDSGKDRLPPYRPHHEPADSYHHSGEPAPPQPSAHNYLDRDGPPVSTSYKKPAEGNKYVPYLIGSDNEWGSYGGSYGGNYNKQTAHWGTLDPHNRRKDPANYNYYDVGPPAPPRREPPHESNSVIGYPGPSYAAGGGYGKYEGGSRDRFDYKHQWTRRPGPDGNCKLSCCVFK